jgi:hypothetical protein
VKLISHCCLLPKLIMSGVVPSFPHVPLWLTQRELFYFTFQVHLDTLFAVHNYPLRRCVNFALEKSLIKK